MGLTTGQRQQVQVARGNGSLRAEANGGRPPIAATQRPGMFSGRGVVAARSAERLPGAPPTAMNRIDRPPQAQHPDRPPQAPRADRPSQAPRADRPPQAPLPQMSNRGAAAQDERPMTSPSHPNRSEYPGGARGYENAPHAPASYPQPSHGAYQGTPHSPAPYAQAPRGAYEGAPRAPQGFPQGRGPESQPRPAPQSGGHEQGGGHERQGGERPERGQFR